MLWNMRYVRRLEPYLRNMGPNECVFAGYFKPNQGQSGIEAKELYYIFAEPLYVYPFQRACMARF